MADKGLPPRVAYENEPTGLLALIREYSLETPLPAVQSRIAPTARRTLIEGPLTLEFYPPGYQPNDVFGHLRFALRREPLELGVYACLFEAMDRRKLESWIRTQPTGRFARRAWYLYELLRGESLDVPDVPPTAYVDLLDDQIHITGAKRKVRRQRINDNLLGEKTYCPLVRRTRTLDQWAAKDLRKAAQNLVRDLDPELLARAVNYLYTKETKSSFAIEGESPGPERSRRFVSALTRVSDFDASDTAAFVDLQNSIVDPRYAQSGWRTAQSYVGQTMPDFSEHVHHICPKPGDVPELMRGWMVMTQRLKTSQIHPVISAATAAFGLVFIHPFDDGNGRIHRFLLHHMLSGAGFTPEGIVFPVSAVMLRERRAYNRALETVSGTIQPFIDFVIDPEGNLTVNNETSRLYRYFDATPLAEYLFSCVDETIRVDLKEELSFLKAFDSAFRRTLDIVDMPNRRANLLVRLIMQNKGSLARRRRADFAELTDDEIGSIEAAVRGAISDLQ